MLSETFLGPPAVVEFVCPTRKFFGVNGLGSDGSTGTCVSGREFRMFAASRRRLRSASNFGATSLSVIDSTRLVLTHAPPASGLAGQLNIQSMPLVAVSRRTASESRKSRSRRTSLLAPTKFVPVSLRICFGIPRSRG